MTKLIRTPRPGCRPTYLSDASMASPALTGMPINYQERRIWHLHEQLDAMIGDVPEHLRVPRLLDPYVE